MTNLERCVLLFGAALAIISIFALVGKSDYESEQDEEEVYCEMVKLWRRDEAAGIAPHRRVGWAPYRGECHGGE